MSEEEQRVVQELRDKISRKSVEEIQDWIMFTRVAGVILAGIGVVLCLIMLYYPSWMVIVPGMILIYFAAQAASVTAGMREICQEFLAKKTKR